MRTLLSYIPLFGCTAMMAVCLVVMCGKRLFRRPGASTPAPAADAGSNATQVNEQVAALRREVEQLRAATAARVTDPAEDAHV